ncbi:F-box protein At2g26160-like, partial [Phragmites australis]|uniref:F-box protein At2g26160-like n=1 Tax=Phragmites australis TaxID=29695 RepID=UPI002D79EAF8
IANSEWKKNRHSISLSLVGLHSEVQTGPKPRKLPPPPRVDWSTLPGDLVRLVSGRLHDPLDFLRLRAVCRSWRSVAASPPPFLPWLLARPAYPTTAALSFFSLASGAARSVVAPSSSHRLLDPTRSHLLLSDNPHLLLVNPLTGAQLPLPSSPFPASSPVIQGYLVPGADESPAPVVLYSAEKLFFHFRHPNPAGGEPTDSVDGWTEVPVAGLVAENMYHDGKLFVCDDHGHVTAFDAATLAVVGAMPPLPPASHPRRDAFKCIAFVPSGDELLCVIRYFRRDGRGDLLEDCGGLEVYRLEMEIGRERVDQPLSPQWVRMRTIGNRMLFVGLYQGFSFHAADFAGFKGDCIYCFKLERAKRSSIYRFSMEDGRTEELPGPWMHACTWFMPSLS